MIDWFAGVLPCTHHPIKLGREIRLTPDDEIEFEKLLYRNVKGSDDSNFTVKSIGSDGQGRATHLKLSGNPAKFLQGHNVFGSDDLLSLMIDVYKKITKALNINYTADDFKNVKTGNYLVTSIDINYSFDLPSKADVDSWLRAALYKSKNSTW